MPKQTPNYRVREDARLLAAQVKFSEMCRWHKRSFPGAVAISPHTWQVLKEGGVVNEHAVRVLSRYMNRKGIAPFDDGPYSLSVIAEATGDRTTTDYRPVDLWGPGWRGLLAHVEGGQGGAMCDSHALPGSEAEVREMARHTVREAGRNMLGDAGESEMVRAGEALFRRPTARLEDWFVTLWKAQPRSVVHSVAYTRDGKPVRCGVTVILPLTRAAFEAYCRGELDSAAVGSAEMHWPSADLLVFALSEYAAPGLSERALANARLLTGITQIAMQAPFLLSGRRRLRLACHEVYPRLVQRSRTFGFIPNGCNDRGMGKPIAVLEYPAAGGLVPSTRLERLKRLPMYGAFIGTLVIVQSLQAQAYLRMKRTPARAR